MNICKIYQENKENIVLVDSIVAISEVEKNHSFPKKVAEVHFVNMVGIRELDVEGA